MASKIRIPIKTPQEIAKLRIACQASSEVLQQTARWITAGKTTAEIDAYAAECIANQQGKSAFLGYRGFPSHICISVNEEVIHGMASQRVVKDGDIVKIDVGVAKGGWLGDNATTVPVGHINEETRRLLHATETALYAGIDQARAGAFVADIGAAIEDSITPFGFGIVRDFVGHGVGRTLHEEPQVPNYRTRGRSPKLRAGMVIAIEPMINLGTPSVHILDDGWTVVTKDKKNAAHFEHTVLITNGKPEILTSRPREATAEQMGL